MTTFWILAAAVAAIAMLFGLVLAIRSEPAVRTLHEKVIAAQRPNTRDLGDGREDHWLSGANFRHDSRRSIRRKGNLTPVSVCTPESFPYGAVDGLILDRSPDGLGFACEKDFAVGSILFVGRREGLESPVWVSVTVRNVRPSADFWIVGGEFLEKPGMQALLMFG
jgi:hypothetical protein